MTHQQTPPDRTAVRLRLDLATRTAQFLGRPDAATAVAAELKTSLGELVEAQDRGDAHALAEAIARVNRILDHVEIEWTRAVAR